MFSFHKPKVYRSQQGCCICKAKSSSSRFTDSKRYEPDFKECFQLVEPRQGEICNACVLLVKRFKRMDPNNRRNWSHVVDARIGPGIKSMTKFKKRKAEQALLESAGASGSGATVAAVASSSTEFVGTSNSNVQNIRNNNSAVERFGKIMRKIHPKKLIQTRSLVENRKPASSTSSSDNEENTVSDRLECDEDMSSIFDNDIKRNQRKRMKPVKNRNKNLHNGLHVIDLNLWAKRSTCCGLVYENKQHSAIMIDSNQYTMDSCKNHAKPTIVVPFVNEENKDELIQIKSSVIKSLPPKKQHFLRHTVIESAQMIESMEQSAPIDYSKPSTSKQAMQQPQQQQIIVHSTTKDNEQISNSLLHITRADNGKIIKKTPRKTMDAARNLMKLCTSIQLANATTITPVNPTNLHNAKKQIEANEHNVSEAVAIQTEPIAVIKYSDNSSDSGYDDTLHDSAQLSQIAAIGATRPVVRSTQIQSAYTKLADVTQTAQTSIRTATRLSTPTITTYKCITPTKDRKSTFRTHATVYASSK